MICLIVFTLFVNLVFYAARPPGFGKEPFRYKGKHLSCIRESTFPLSGKPLFPNLGRPKVAVFTKKAPLVVRREAFYEFFDALVFAEEGVSLNRTFYYIINTNVSSRRLSQGAFDSIIN